MSVNDTPPSSLARLSMSLPAELFRQLDMMVEERGLPSRSQLIAELIRHELAEHEATRPEDMLAGTITMVYRGDMGPGAASARPDPGRVSQGSHLLAARLP
jgi:CopG family nickel-responsive transcriptional regulator